MSHKIEIVMASQVDKGEHVCEVDDDSLTTNASVNEHYDAADQDWHWVAHVHHMADLAKLTLQMYNGEQYVATGSSEQLLWRLVDETGAPVVTSEEDMR